MKMASYPSLAERRVFITGGATGIGAALVEAFSEQHAEVGFIDIDAENGSALAGRTGASFEQVDVSAIPAMRASVTRFADRGLDILINNVADDTRHDIMEIDEAAWRACMAVNLDAAFFAAQTAFPFLKKADAGVIINLSSINAFLGQSNMPGYVAAKSALLGLTKSLARAFGPDGVRVNAIAPGWVVTERQVALWLTPEAEEEWMAQLALKRRIEPADVARLALFLAAEDSCAITGQTFVIDGGRT